MSWLTAKHRVKMYCAAVALLGAYGAAATLGKTANVFEVVSGLDIGWISLLLFLVVIALDNWTINVLNLYTGGLSLSNMFERLGRFWTTVVISLLGIALSATPDVVKGYTSYVGILGNIFSPIGGVLLADYLFVKRMHIDIVALFEADGSYRYWKGVNPIAVAWTAIGFLAYMYVIPAEWIRAGDRHHHGRRLLGNGAAAVAARLELSTGVAPGPLTARGHRRSRLGTCDAVRELAGVIG